MEHKILNADLGEEDLKPHVQDKNIELDPEPDSESGERKRLEDERRQYRGDQPGEHLGATGYDGADKDSRVDDKLEKDILIHKGNIKEEMTNIGNENRKFINENESLTKHIEDMKTENTNLKKQIESLKKDNAEKTVAGRDFAEKDIKSQQTMMDLRNELETLQTSFDDLKTEKATMDTQHNKQKKASTKERERLTRSLESETENHKQYRQKAENEMKRKIDQKEKEIKDIKEKSKSEKDNAETYKKTLHNRIKTMTNDQQQADKEHKRTLEILERDKKHLSDKLQELNDRMQKREDEHKRRCIELENKVKGERSNFNRLSYQTNELTQEKQGYYERILSLQEENKHLDGEKQGLLLRLSKLAGANLTYNNPNIADLSDDKRPTKLSEEFSELYDNEWTDAFEEVETDDDEQKTNFMLQLLKRANQICFDLSNEHVKKIKHSLSTLTLPTPTKPSNQGDHDMYKDTTKNKNTSSCEIQQTVEMKEVIKMEDEQGAAIQTANVEDKPKADDEKHTVTEDRDDEQSQELLNSDANTDASVIKMEDVQGAAIQTANDEVKPKITSKSKDDNNKSLQPLEATAEEEKAEAVPKITVGADAAYTTATNILCKNEDGDVIYINKLETAAEDEEIVQMETVDVQDGATHKKEDDVTPGADDKENTVTGNGNEGAREEKLTANATSDTAMVPKETVGEDTADNATKETNIVQMETVDVQDGATHKKEDDVTPGADDKENTVTGNGNEGAREEKLTANATSDTATREQPNSASEVSADAESKDKDATHTDDKENTVTGNGNEGASEEKLTANADTAVRPVDRNSQEEKQKTDTVMEQIIDNNNDKDKQTREQPDSTAEVSFDAESKDKDAIHSEKGNQQIAEQKPKKQKLESDFELLRNEQKKTIFEARKFFEFQLSADVGKAVTDIIVQERGLNKEKHIVAYIEKCVNISWSMCRHEPPVYVDFPDVTDDIPFDTNKYKPYTKTGKHIAYVVWPALYLHERGPMLSKGVAQGK